MLHGLGFRLGFGFGLWNVLDFYFFVVVFDLFAVLHDGEADFHVVFVDDAVDDVFFGEFEFEYFAVFISFVVFDDFIVIGIAVEVQNIILIFCKSDLISK